MNNPLSYRPNSRTPLLTAFAFAAVLHITAVALGAWRTEPGPSISPDKYTDVDIVAPPNQPESLPQEDIPLPPAPPSIETPEFVEQPQPIVHRPNVGQQRPIRPPGAPGSRTTGNPRAFALSAPRPEYPYEARRRGITGSGVVRLTIDSTSGTVTSATMMQSLGNAILDRSALSAFQRWRFRPGTPAVVTIPVTYTLSGVAY